MTNYAEKDNLLGSFKGLIHLFFPIALMSFSNSIYLFIEKLMLAKLSLHYMEAAISATYVTQIFLSPCIVFAMMSQVFVGHNYGAKTWSSIGPGIWQFIWFCILSICVTLPSSYAYGNYYFEDTLIKDIVLPYYYISSCINFLFPLGAVLACFYIGRGKTRLVFWATLLSQSLKFMLSYLFIFGYGPIPSLGLLGGVISTGIAQIGFCLILFSEFLNKSNSELFHTRNWQFKWKLFCECIHTGIARAFCRIFSMANWAAIAHLMSAKNEKSILILSLGGSFMLFLPFLGDALLQSQTTIISQILGSKQLRLFKRALSSGLILSAFIISAMAIPLILFPLQTLHYTFPYAHLEPDIAKNVLMGLWIDFTFYTLTCLLISYSFAFKDSSFMYIMAFAGWINGFFWMYFIIEILQIDAKYFWITLGFMHFSNAAIYYWRAKYLSQNYAPFKTANEPTLNPNA